MARVDLPITDDDDLAARLRFALEVDQLKLVERRSYVAGGQRRENSAEHSWHVALLALALGPVLGDVDLSHVVQLLLVHDVVEVDAGDVDVYDTAGRAAVAVAEVAAADRIFGLLPEPTGASLRALWDEYEDGETPEAVAARAVDRIQPALLNWFSEGRTWQELGVTAERVRAVNGAALAPASARLEAALVAILGDAVGKGWLSAR